MAVDKLVPRYLNKDNDPRVLKSIEMVDALNVRLSNDTDGNAGVIKNVKGNTIVPYKNTSDELPTGENKVIGTMTNLQKDEVFYFVWNENNDHSIYKYSLSSDVVICIYRDSVLNFNKNSFVKADAIVNQYNDTLLYFTDGINEPKKLNASKAERGAYPSEYSEGSNPSTTLSDEERLLFITTAKQPPLSPPTWEFFTNSSVTTNNLYEKTFQFAYQYVYNDGEVSAISAYSTVAFTNEQLSDGLLNNEAKKNNNGLRVSVKTNVGDVSKIRVLARSSSSDVFVIIDEIDNDRTSVYDKIVEFYNDGSYGAVTPDQVNKLFDNVPLSAESQAISGNRLMYANYTEGYNNVDTDGEVLPNYKERGQTYDTALTLNIDNNNTTKTFSIRLADLPGYVEPGGTYTVDINMSSDYVKLDLKDYPMSWREWQRNGGENRMSGLVKDYVNVDMTSISVNDSYTVPFGMSKSLLAVQIIEMLQKDIPVSFDSVDQYEDHATKIYDVEEDQAVGPEDNERYAFFRGDGTVQIKSCEYNSSTESITGTIVIKDAQLKATTVYGSTIDLGGDAPDYTDLRNIRDYTYAGLGLTVSYKGDGGSYTAYDKTPDDAHFDIDDIYSRIGQSRFIDTVSSNNSRYLSGSAGSLSFKAGATHGFGVVYYDDRNRSGTVQKISESYVKWFGERGAKGATSMVMRLKHNAPSWAKRWSPVYSGNTTLVNSLQYSVIEAYTESNPTAIKSAASDYNNKIFVSFRSLSGKEDSYKESKGALIDYSFTEGDKLRVLSFGKNYYPNGVEFNVVGYEYLTASPTDNPIYDDSNENTKYKTTGFFLILEDNGHQKFGKGAVVGGNDDWDNKCIIELYSSRKTSEGLPFYEIGSSYPVTNGVHGDEREESTTNIDVQINGNWGYFKSEDKVYKGDVFTGSGVSIRINNVNPSSDSDYEFQGDCQVLSGSTSGIYSMTVQNNDAVVEITDGDVYFRLRQMRYGTDVSTYNYLTDYIEDSSLSDFFSSKQQSQGRSNLYSPNTMQMKRKASVTYSEPFNYDSANLLLSSFNLSLANFSDFDNSYGGIKFIQNSGDSLICLQENKMSAIPVGRNIIQYASDNSDLVASNNILGTPQYMSGDYGCGNNPESVSIRFGRVYFADVRAGKVLSFGASGIEPISEKEMDSYFTEKFSTLSKVSSTFSVNGGYDPDTDEYLISTSDVYNTSVVVTYDGDTYTSDHEATAGLISSNPVGGSEFLQWENADYNWEDLFVNWNDAGNGVFYIDRNDEDMIRVDDGLHPYGVYNIVVTTTDNQFIGAAYLFMSTGNIQLVDGDGVSYDTSGSTKVYDGFTAAYSPKTGYWTTRYSYIPERMGFVKNLFFTFKDGRVYTHETNDNYNTFYGTSYPSTLSVVSNYNPSMVKSYETISLEGDTAWDSVFKNTDQQSSVASVNFDKRERNYYAHIGRDTLNSTGQLVTIGEVDSVSGDVITITSRISNMPIAYESDILKVSGTDLIDSNLKVSSIIGRKQLQADSTVSGISAGDVLVSKTVSSTDGDAMRDYYLQIDLTNNSTSALELYAVNTTFRISNVHDQQGQ